MNEKELREQFALIRGRAEQIVAADLPGPEREVLRELVSACLKIAEDFFADIKAIADSSDR